MHYFKAVVGIFVIALLSCLPLFGAQFFVGSDDLAFHLVRIEGLAAGLFTGQFPVRLYPVFNQNFGYPLGIFYGDWLLYFPAILRIVGTPPLLAYQCNLAFINILTAGIAYLSFWGIFRRQHLAFLLAAFYCLANYRLMNLYFRAALGEYTAMAFLPWIAFALWRIYSGGGGVTPFRHAFFLAVGFLALLYTHILSTQMAFLALILVALILYFKTFTRPILKTYACFLIIFIIGGLAFIIPFLDYYLQTPTIIKELNKTPFFIARHSLPFLQLFTDIFKSNFLDSNESATLTPGIILFFFIFGLFYLTLKRQFSKTCLFFIILSLCFLVLTLSIFPWDFLAEHFVIFHYLSHIRFPWRFISFAVLSMCLFLGCFYKENPVLLKPVFYAIPAIFIVFSTFYFFKDYQANNIFFVKEIPLMNILDNCTGCKKYNNIGGDDYILSGTPIDDIQSTVFSNKAQVQILKENGIFLLFKIQAEENAFVDIPRFAYPYLKAQNENGEFLITDVGFQNRLRIIFKNAYNGIVWVDFYPPFYWHLSEIISILSLIFCLFLIQKTKNPR